MSVHVLRRNSMRDFIKVLSTFIAFLLAIVSLSMSFLDIVSYPDQYYYNVWLAVSCMAVYFYSLCIIGDKPEYGFFIANSKQLSFIILMFVSASVEIHLGFMVALMCLLVNFVVKFLLHDCTKGGEALIMFILLLICTVHGLYFYLYT